MFFNSMKENLYKIMWLPDTENLFLKMTDETEAELSVKNYFITELQKNIDLNEWQIDYRKAYKMWLEDDDNTIYDIHNPLIFNIIEAVNKVNQQSEKLKLYYWFDIDRSANENFRWEKCPITNTELKNLGKDYFYVNRLVSEKASLVMPEVDNLNNLLH